MPKVAKNPPPTIPPSPMDRAPTAPMFGSSLAIPALPRASGPGPGAAGRFCSRSGPASAAGPGKSSPSRGHGRQHGVLALRLLPQEDVRGTDDLHDPGRTELGRDPGSDVREDEEIARRLHPLREPLKEDHPGTSERGVFPDAQDESRLAHAEGRFQMLVKRLDGGEIG